MKNIISIPVYNNLLQSDKYGEPYSKCIDTWKFYCDKYNIELYLIEGNKTYEYNGTQNDYAAMCFDRWLDIKINYSEYDRITFVDADTIVRWDAFDFNKIFLENNLDIVVVQDQGGSGVPEYHLNQWLGFNPNIPSFIKGYFNAGFVSMKSHHLLGLQKELVKYREYYYTEKDINGHVEGIGKIGGVRLDAMDQTAVNIILQELYSSEITFAPKIFNCQVPYLFNGTQDFINRYKNFEFLNEGIIFHLGSTTLAYTDFINDFWDNFEINYK